MNRSTGGKIKELLHITGISLSVVVMTATLLRFGLVPKNRVQRRQESISVQELNRHLPDARRILYSLQERQDRPSPQRRHRPKRVIS